jgi:tetratricopeptide (TPR) repeat protein
VGTGNCGKRHCFAARLRKRAASQIVLALVLLTSAAAIAQTQQTAQQKHGTPLDQRQVQGLVEGGVYSERIANIIAQRGIDFKPSPAYLQALRQDGAQEVLIRALLAAKPPVPVARNASFTRPIAHSRTQQSQDLTQERVARILARAELDDEQRNWADAEQEYRTALRLDPHRASVHAQLGDILVAENEPQVAMEEYRQAVSLQPDLAAAHRALGSLLIKTGDVSEGIGEYRDALRLQPDDTELRARVAALLYSRGDLRPAIAEYQALAAASADNPDVHYRLGLVLYADSDLTGAAAQFRRALALNPHLSQAHDALGDLLLKQGDRAGALEQYREGSRSGDGSFNETLNWLSKSLTH